MPQLPASTPGSYPPSTMTADAYPKVPLSGTSNYTSEPQEMPLQTSMPPPVPLSLVSNDQTQPPLRSPYNYAPPSTTTPPAGTDSALSVPRYVDNPRPTKSPRHSSHQSVHSASSAANPDASPEYRYGAYAPVNSGSGDVAQASYPADATGPTSAPPRDYYPSTGTWTTTAGEQNSSVGYAGGDGRGYSFTHDQYKAGTPGAPPVKADPSQPGAQAVYGGGPRGSFDAMNNYSWSSS